MSTDRDLTRVLHSWLHEDAHEDADRVLNAVLDRLETTPQRRATWLAWRTRPLVGQWGMNRTLAIALVLVALLIISIGIAVAGGLLRNDRNDRNDTNSFSLAGPVGHCDQTLPDGVLIMVVDRQTQTQLTAYEDGLVVTGYPADWGATAASGVDGSWSQRRLTADGIHILVDALTSSLPSCQSFEHSGSRDVRARTGAEVHSIRIGADVLETRVTTAAQAAAVRDLVARLDDPDLGLPARDWVDGEWGSYVPERWRFSLQFSGPSDREYPPSDGIVLPDGSSLRAFGSEESIDSIDPSARPQGLTMLRCAVTDAEEARVIAAMLSDASGSRDDQSGWYFTDGEQVGELGGSPLHNLVSVTVVGLLPHEPDCLGEAAPAAAPTPAPAPSTPADEAAPFADACDYVPAALVGEVIGPVAGATEHYPGWSTEWAFCWYPVDREGLAVFASRRPVPGDRAAAQARALFGDVGFSAEQIAGHDVFMNGCEGTGGQCRAAVAISAYPHFLVVTWQGGSQATLRHLAERLIQLLDSAAAV